MLAQRRGKPARRKGVKSNEQTATVEKVTDSIFYDKTKATQKSSTFADIFSNPFDLLNKAAADEESKEYKRILKQQEELYEMLYNIQESEEKKQTKYNLNKYFTLKL